MSDLSENEPVATATTRPGATALALRARRRVYGVDAPAAGPIPLTAFVVLAGGLALLHRRSRPRVAVFELLSSLFCLVTLAFYMHTTRRGKFEAWADVLEELSLRGDERVL